MNQHFHIDGAGFRRTESLVKPNQMTFPGFFHFHIDVVFPAVNVFDLLQVVQNDQRGSILKILGDELLNHP